MTISPEAREAAEEIRIRMELRHRWDKDTGYEFIVRQQCQRAIDAETEKMRAERDQLEAALRKLIAAEHMFRLIGVPELKTVDDVINGMKNMAGQLDLVVVTAECDSLRAENERLTAEKDKAQRELRAQQRALEEAKDYAAGVVQGSREHCHDLKVALGEFAGFSNIQSVITLKADRNRLAARVEDLEKAAHWVLSESKPSSGMHPAKRRALDTLSEAINQKGGETCPSPVQTKSPDSSLGSDAAPGSEPSEAAEAKPEDFLGDRPWQVIRANNATLRAEVARLTQERNGLYSKGVSLCSQNGNLLLDLSTLRATAKATIEAAFREGRITGLNRDEKVEAWHSSTARKQMEAL